MKTSVKPTLSLLIMLAVVGCSSSAESEGADPSRPTENAEASKPYVWEMDQFVKVQREDNSPPLLQETSDKNLEQFANGRVAQLKGRSYMMPDTEHDQFALYEGEQFTVDIAYLTKNLPTQDLTLRVLANFKAVEFKFIRFENEEPTFAEFSERETFDHKEISVKEGELYKFSLLVPSEQFERKGAYDIRIVASPNVAPRPDPEQVRVDNFNFPITLYYHGDSYPSAPPAIEPSGTIEFDRAFELMRTFSLTALPSPEYLAEGSEFGDTIDVENLEPTALLAHAYSQPGSPREPVVLVRATENGLSEPVWVRDIPDFGRASRENTTIPHISSEEFETSNSFSFIMMTNPYTDHSDRPIYEARTYVSNLLFVE